MILELLKEYSYKVLNRQGKSNMLKIAIRAIRDVRTDGPTLIIEEHRF